MKNIKYLFLTLNIQDGENLHNHKVLLTTKANDILFAAERYTARYYGYPDYHDNGAWFFSNGTIAVKINSLSKLTKRHFDILKLYI